MNKIVKIGVFLMCILGIHNSYAQEESESSGSIAAKNTVYAEILGKGFYYSINYERNIYEINEQISFQGSAGFTLMDGLYTDEYKELIDGMSADFLMPLELNVRYRMGNHNIVAGYGTTYWRYYLPEIEINNSNWEQQPIAPSMKKVTEWFAHLVLEYRWQKPDGGLMAKAGWSPLFFAKMENFKYQKKTNFANSFNIGVGYSF